MKKEFGSQTCVFPSPVFIIATYDDDGTPNAMNAAWGGTYDSNKVFVSLSSHKTTDNLAKRKAFTISFADAAHEKEADYFGMVSGRRVKDKIARAGMTVTKSQHVDAPVINEFPITIECEVESFDDGLLVGRIVNVLADESVLTDGKIDATKAHLITFDGMMNRYIELGEAVGHCFKDGLEIK